MKTSVPADKHPEREKHDATEREQRPVGQRQLEEDPLLAGAEAGSKEQRWQLHAEPVDQALDQVGIAVAAFIDAFGESLHPGLIGGNGKTEQTGGSDQPSPEAPSKRQQQAEESQAANNHQQQALENAQRTGRQPVLLLQTEAKNDDSETPQCQGGKPGPGGHLLV